MAAALEMAKMTKWESCPSQRDIQIPGQPFYKPWVSGARYFHLSLMEADAPLVIWSGDSVEKFANSFSHFPSSMKSNQRAQITLREMDAWCFRSTLGVALGLACAFDHDSKPDSVLPIP